MTSTRNTVDDPDAASRRDSGLLHDAPLTDPSEDKLGRATFAVQLGKAILSMDAEDGFV